LPGNIVIFGNIKRLAEYCRQQLGD